MARQEHWQHGNWSPLVATGPVRSGRGPGARTGTGALAPACSEFPLIEIVAIPTAVALILAFVVAAFVVAIIIAAFFHADATDRFAKIIRAWRRPDDDEG